MATRFLARSFNATKPSLTSAFCSSATTASASSAVLPNAFLFRLRPLVAAVSASYFRRLLPAISTRAFSTRQTASSLNDPNPNWSNRPPKETILLDGCDFEHWLVVVEKPDGDPTRDEIIDSYIKTLAMVVGSEEEARMKIYSVSTRHYYAFGALVNEELSYKLKELPKVRWVLPDSYLNVREKDYGGEPFINGQAVPYDPKYHEEWVRNNARANERNRRNDRPRNFDRSRNFERRREMQGPPGGPAGGPPGNYGGPPGGPGGNYGGPPMAPPPNAGPNMGGQPNYGPNNPGNNMRPPNFQNGPGPNQGSFPAGPGPNAGGGSPYQNQNYPGGDNRGFGPGPNSGNFAPNAGYGPAPTQNFGPAAPYQNAYDPSGGSPPQGQGQNIPGRDFPPPSNY